MTTQRTKELGIRKVLAASAAQLAALIARDYARLTVTHALTVSFQALKTACTNPVEALRRE